MEAIVEVLPPPQYPPVYLPADPSQKPDYCDYEPIMDSVNLNRNTESVGVYYSFPFEIVAYQRNDQPNCRCYDRFTYTSKKSIDYLLPDTHW